MEQLEGWKVRTVGREIPTLPYDDQRHVATSAVAGWSRFVRAATRFAACSFPFWSMEDGTRRSSRRFLSPSCEERLHLVVGHLGEILVELPDRQEHPRHN